jgi:4-hydroxybutyrate CoA-transferase
MSWKEKYADKLRTPEEAVKVVENGDLVAFGANSPWMDCWALTSALAKRAPELRDVTISGTFSLAAEVLLLGPGTEESWKYLTGFCMTPEGMGKLTARSKQIDLIPLSSFTTELMAGPFREELAAKMVPNVLLITCTLPDKNGLVTFSAHLWGVRRLIDSTKLGGGIVIGEVNDTLPIIPGGDNWMSIDAFDHLVEATPLDFLSMVERLTAPSPPEEEEKEAVICAQVAELINDGDTIMFGGGRIPMKMGPFLEHKVDLGCHTELVVPLDLMKKGVINNKRRNLVPGKTSCTAVAYATKEEEEYVDGNPLFDIRDLGLNNHPRYICQNENMVAINAPLEITLFGEIGMERVGRRYFRGVGGQVEFILGTLMSRNGRSIHATLSTAKTPQGVVSRIVPQLTYPAVSSIPRQFVDFIVTEYGIVSLLGKTEREKANELIAVAHPDFRPWLREEVKKLYLD